MLDETFARLRTKLREEGPRAALAALIATFDTERQFDRLFEAHLLRARHELGLPLVLERGLAEVPIDRREAYEQRVLESCRLVGARFLESGDIPSAFRYFRLVDELGAVREAIERLSHENDEAMTDAILEIAIGHGVHPAKGLAHVLYKYGHCQAITTFEQLMHQELKDADRADCARILVRALHEQLIERLRAEIVAREGEAPVAASIGELLESRDWLLADDNYHIDVSHLAAVVRFARLIPSGAELSLAAELCDYGSKLSDRYQHPDPPPFERLYDDSRLLFRAWANNGNDNRELIESAIEHFRPKAEQATTNEPYAAEIFLLLLERAGRIDEAIEFAGRTINAWRTTPLFAPRADVLCQRYRRFAAMAELAHQRGDVVGFLAGLLQQPADAV